MFFSIVPEKYTWLFEDNMAAPLFKHKCDLISGDSLRIHFDKISFDRSQTQLFISGYLISPLRGLSDMGVIMAGCKKDTLVKIGFINDHTAIYEDNNQALKFSDYVSCRFKKLERFDCTLNIKSNYDLLIVGINSYFGLLLDLKKILETYHR